MDKKKNTNDEKMFQEGDFPFPFGNAQNMREMMKPWCGGEGIIMDCCSMMGRMAKRDKGKRQRENEGQRKNQ